MKILLYQKGEKVYRKSGLGRAMKHQEMALRSAGVDFSIDEDSPYDLVHINTLDPGARRMAKKARKNGKKVIYHAHSTEEDFRNSFILSNQLAPLFKKYLIATYNLGDAILTPTPHSKRLLDRYGLRPPIEDISNGIDLDRFRPDPAKSKTFCDFFGIEEDDKVVVSVGLYFERKGFHDFIQVAQALPEVTFIWFGHTPAASLTHTIRQAIASKSDNVVLPGYIKGDILEGAYARADVFFFPSYEESEGIVVLEALASKCQLLLRDIDTYSPWLTDTVNCYLGNSNEEFVELIARILKQELPATVDAGYEVANQRSIEKIGARLKSIYQRVLEETS